MPSLTLVSHHLCPYVQRAAISLQEKGAPFERIYVDLGNKPDWFTALSPLGKVPLLQVEGTALFESAVILEYLEDTIKPALHPVDPLERALHRAWMEFGSAILGDLWGFETAKDGVLFEAKREALLAKFGRVEAVFGEGPYFAGAHFSLVDCVFAPIFRYFDVFDAIADTAIFDTTPKLRGWRAVLQERESVRGAVTEDYGERLRGFLERHDAHLLRLRD